MELKEFFLQPCIDSKIVEIEGFKVEIKKPTRKQMKLLTKKARIKVGTGQNTEIDVETGYNYQLYQAIELCYNPETGEKLFCDADLPMMDNTSTSGFLALLLEEVTSFITPEKSEVIEKN